MKYTLTKQEYLARCSRLVEVLQLIRDGYHASDTVYSFVHNYRNHQRIYYVGFANCGLLLEPEYFGMTVAKLDTLLQYTKWGKSVRNELAIYETLNLLEHYMKKRFGAKNISRLFSNKD